MAFETNLDKSPDRIAGMFDAIAPRYDLLNTVLSAGLDRYWRRRAIGSLGLPATKPSSTCALVQAMWRLPLRVRVVLDSSLEWTLRARCCRERSRRLTKDGHPPTSISFGGMP